MYGDVFWAGGLYYEIKVWRVKNDKYNYIYIHYKVNIANDKAELCEKIVSVTYWSLPSKGKKGFFCPETRLDNKMFSIYLVSVSTALVLFTKKLKNTINISIT